MSSSKWVAAGSVGAILGFVAGWIAAPSAGGGDVSGMGDEAVPAVTVGESEVREGVRRGLARERGESRDDPRWNESDSEFYRRRAEERQAGRESMFRSDGEGDGDEGIAPEWNPYVPEVLRPGGFEDQVRRAVEECEPDMDLVGFDCSEPPCLAIFRDLGGDSGTLTSEDCAAWHDSFGSWKTSSSDMIDCPDGVSERVLLIGSSRTHDWIDEPEGGGRGNGMKRLKARSAPVMDGWECATD